MVQAALSGYSDLAMRRVARAYGATYTLNEVVLDRLVNNKGVKQKQILNVEQDDHPLGGQLMGSNPDDFAPAARRMADAGYDTIDINFGCPVRKVLGRCRGGFLLSDPTTAIEIMRRVMDAVGDTHPVTVKMRRATDDSREAERHFYEIIDGAFDLGLSAVTVHARTVAQRYVGPSRWTFLSAVKKHVGNRTILGSGDLFSATACRRMLEETGVDGVSIARGCIGNPWIFQEFKALYGGRPLPPPPSYSRQRSAIARHWRELVNLYGEDHGTRTMRKFGIKYCEHHPHARQVRDSFIQMKTPGDFHQVLETWYRPQPDWPPIQRRESHGDLVAAGATL